MHIQFQIQKKPEFRFHYRELARRLIPLVLEEEAFPYQAEVTITLTDDARIRELNQRMRGMDAATDVLSFPLVDYSEAADYTLLCSHLMEYYNPDTRDVMLGDIVLSVDHVRQQAAEYGHSEKREYAFLLTHSMLHLLGYDHMTQQERKIMEDRQRRILDRMGITRRSSYEG